MNQQPVEILLVEDNPHDVELTLRALQRHNLANAVHVVRDGAEALEYIFGTGAYADHGPGRAPRVILLDLKLPKVDGLEVLRQIKSDPRTRTIPVVVMTSSREERDIVESYGLGANSYIVKPVDFEQFVEAARIMGASPVRMSTGPLWVLRFSRHIMTACPVPFCSASSKISSTKGWPVSGSVYASTMPAIRGRRKSSTPSVSISAIPSRTMPTSTTSKTCSSSAGRFVPTVVPPAASTVARSA